jgi:hypothetical protein
LADRALLGVIPKARRQGLRLLVTPDTIVRWHRDIVRRRWPPGLCAAGLAPVPARLALAFAAAGAQCVVILRVMADS